MKKFLSLVLALVMTMSLVTVSAGAKDFTDASKINYKEAIDVMSAVKVIDGYEDGSINPQGGLTRGAAAKIICNLVLGPTDAAALKVTEAPYKDVPVDSTYAGYIAYCKSAGYVSGYVDGTFKPGAPLTGYAFMKMLLGTLGLDKNIEGYEGTNWSINVAKRALNLKLSDGLVGSFNGTKAINREEAMLFAFNTLNTRVFEYSSKGSSISVGGVEIVTGASTASQKNVASGNGLSDNQYLREQLFDTDLTKVTVENNMKKPATKWSYKNKEVGTYASTPKLTYTTGVTQKEVYTALDLAAGTQFNYYVDAQHASAVTSPVMKDADNNIHYSGRGIVTEIYYKADGSQKLILTTQANFGTVAAITKDSDGNREIIIGGKHFKTEDFAKGDKVVYTLGKDESTGAVVITDVYAVEKQTGTITKKVGTGTYYIDGTEYKTNESEGLSIAGNVKDEVEFYLDQYGYIVYMKATSATAAVDNLAYVSVGGEVKGTGWVKMYKANGTAAEVVDITKDGSNYADKLVTYKMDGSKYALETVGKYYNTTATRATNYSFTKGATTISGFTNEAADWGVKFDAKTTFMVINAKGDMKTYTGIKNMPTVTNFHQFAVYEKSGTAVLMVIFAEDNQVSTNSSALTFVVFNKKADENKVDLGDGKSYTTYTTFNKGVTASKDFASFAESDFHNDNSYDNYLVVLSSYSIDSDGYISSPVFATMGTAGSYNFSTDDYVRGTDVSEVKNGVIMLDDVAFVVADDCNVITVAKDGEVIADNALDSIVENEAGTHYYYNDVLMTWNSDNEINQIILCLA